jgi:hypothetical protein
MNVLEGIRNTAHVETGGHGRIALSVYLDDNCSSAHV